MSKISKVIELNRFTLIVELAGFDAEIAHDAIEAGADVLLLNDHVEDAHDLKACPRCIDIPFGVNLINPKKLKPGLYEDLEKYGVDFIEYSIQTPPAQIDKVKKLGKMQSLGADYTLDKLMELKDDNADVVNATIFSKSEWGKELSVGDLQHFISICISSNVPVLVPTQKRIRPSEVSIIWDTGAKGLILTPNMLPKKKEELIEVIQEYRAAVDDLGDQ
jgi:hypothetical protein